MSKDERLSELRATGRCGDGTPTIALNSVDGLIDMIEYARPETILELGSDMGVSTEVFLLYCKEVVAMDPWGDYPEMMIRVDHVQKDNEENHLRMRREHGEMFMARCGAYPNLTVLRDYSPDGVLKMNPKYLSYFDLVYVDAVHEYQAIIDDIRAAFPLVRAGGWISGHDYWPPSNSHNIIPAVNGLFGKENLKIFSDGSWVARRPETLPDMPLDPVPVPIT